MLCTARNRTAKTVRRAQSSQFWFELRKRLASARMGETRSDRM